MTAETTGIPIHIINLDRSPERMEFMRGQFSAAGLGGQVRRFAAVDARAPGFAPAGYAPHLWLDRWELETSEQAVFESHRALWERVAKDPGPGAVICEDDILVSREFGPALAALDLASFGVVKLDGFSVMRRYGPVFGMDGFELRAILEPVPSAACYALGPVAARALLDASRQYCATLDDFLFAARPGLNPVQLFPAVAAQGMTCQPGPAGPIPGQVAQSERDGPGNARGAKKGPPAYRLRKEIRRLARRIARHLGSDRRLVASGGLIGRPDLAADLPAYRD